MKNLSYILFILPVMLIWSNCLSQQVIATAGGSASGTGIELSWTIGEPVTATTFGSGFILTQGFHQGQPAIELLNQQLSFKLGWNIMSANVIPDNQNLKDILQSLIDAGILKKVMDEAGYVIEDYGASNGGWQNFIGNIKSTEGYKINVTSATSFTIGGTTFLFPFNILLKTGWNIISWPSTNEQDGEKVVQLLISEGKLKKVMDEEGKVIEDYGASNGGWQNFIGNFKPGEGYKVNVTTDCILTINENVTKSEKIITQLIPSAHFIPAFQGNGTDHMNINLLHLTESGILEGDEIGVFDGDICVGSVRISNLYASFTSQYSSVSIPVSATDGLESKNGYSDGNPVIIKLFRDGVEYPLTVEPINNSKNVFEKGSSLFAQVGLATGLEGIAKQGLTEVKCYPNPFSDQITINLNLADDAEVSVEVMNQMGQRVKFVSTKQLLNSGVHNLTWNGRNENNAVVSTGIYHLRVTVGESVIHRKIVYTTSE